jgi:anti-anti-sigma factor
MAGTPAAPGFSVETDVSVRPLSIRAAGELDSESSDALIDAFRRALGERPDVPVSLDLQNVSFIDSTGMRTMIQIERIAEQRRVRLIVIPPPDDVTELLRTAGIAERLDVTAAGGRGSLAPDFVDRVNLELDREPAAPSRARAEVREALAGRLDDAAIATVVLLTSELVTNAVIHPEAAGGSTIGLRISVHENGVRIEVDDQGDGFDPAAPAMRPGHGGRGLFLVDRCSAHWGAERTEGVRGDRFCVWFEFLSDEREPATARGGARPSPA